MSNFLAQYLVDFATFLPSEERVMDVISNAGRLTTGLVAPERLAPNPSATKVLFGNNTWGDISLALPPDVILEGDLRLSDARTPLSHNQPWSTITSTPTTLAGYGIADAQPLDSDLTAIALLTTTSFGRSFLDRADASAGRTLLELGTLATQSGTFSGTSSGTNTGDNAVTPVKGGFSL